MRKHMKQNTDKRVFRNTAVSSKKINLGVNLYRGGIRF